MWSDNETSEDLLGFCVHADLLIDVIDDDTLLPVTIGIFGDWGSGKSSIEKIVREKMETQKDVLVLFFNGWVFEGYDDAKAALLESIIKEFEDNTSIYRKVKEQTKKLLKSVDWMRVAGFGFKNIVMPAASAYLTGGISLIPHIAQGLSSMSGKDLAAKIKSGDTEDLIKSFLRDATEEAPMLVRNFRNDFSELIDKAGIKKLIVIIDDLDRCTPDRIIENLEAIKLFLNVEKTAFIIGADSRVVRHAIEFRYKHKTNGTESSNDRIVDDYLEKLIQIPYNLPKLSDSEVETYISLLICKRELPSDTFAKVLTKFQKFREGNRYTVFGFSDITDILNTDEQKKVAESLVNIPSMSSIICQSLYGNPRQIKRFLNTFTLRKRLANVANISDFKDDILAKLMILEYTEEPLFKQLYDWQIIQNGVPNELTELEGLCTGKSISDLHASIKNGKYENWGKEKVIKWLNLDPKLSSVDLRDYFWISRDKISSSIPGESMLPPIVKAIFSEMEQDEIPSSLLSSLIKTKVLTLNDVESAKLLEYCSSKLKNNFEEGKYYTIFHKLIEEKVPNSIPYYKDVLRSINLSNIPAAVGVSLQEFAEHPDFKDFLNSLFEKDSCPAAKAFKIKD